MQKKSGIAKYLSNLRLIFLGYLTVLGLGIMGYFSLPRELMPSVDLPIAIVTATLPGASPSDVEDLVAVPLESRLRSIKTLDSINVTSMENAALLLLQFQEGTDKDRMLNDVREKVETVSLPQDASKPTINVVDFNESPVLTFSLEGKDKVDLVQTAKDLQETLERNYLIDRVEISGVQDREIMVYVSASDMQKYGLHPASLQSIIAAATTNVPAGSLNNDTFSYAVSVQKDVTTVDDLRALPIILNGTQYRLGEIAQIYEQDTLGGVNSYQMTADGQVSQVVTMNVYKIVGAGIDEASRTAKRLTERYLQSRPNYRFTVISDVGEEIADQFNDLFKNIAATILLVFVIIFIFLGIREAFVSSISIPMVMLFTFGVMMACGISLNFITLFALLLVLGMLVDNAIVVTTALSRAYKQTGHALRAGENVWREFFVALISTNLTTIWAFLPLVIITGIMGQFIRPIGIIVTVAMLASALIAFLLTLPLGVYTLEPRFPARLQRFTLISIGVGVSGALWFVLPKNWLIIPIIAVFWGMWYCFYLCLRRRAASSRQQLDKRRQNQIVSWLQHGFFKTDKLEAAYARLLERILSSGRNIKLLLLAMVILTVVSFGLPLAGLVHSSFFPKQDQDNFSMELTLPIGTNTQEVERVALEVLPEFMHLPNLDYVTAEIGRGGMSALMSGGGSGNKILFSFKLIDKKDKLNSSVVLAEKMRREWSNNPYGKAIVTESSSVSAGGSDIQMSITGPEIEVLAAKSEEMVAWLESQPGVEDVTSSLEDTSKRLVFYPDQSKMTEYNLKSTDFAVWLRSNLSGWRLGSIRLSGDNQDTQITLRQQIGQPDISDLQKIKIPVAGVGYVDLGALGEFRVEPSLAQITRNDYEHALTVSASVADGYSSTEINAAFERFIDRELNLPEGYGRKVGGVQDMNNDAMSGLVKAMIVAMFLITLTLVIQLGSFRKAAIVMSVIPVAVSGVFIGFALLGWSLTFPAFIGVLALFGVVVNNSILIVERINQNLAEGKPFRESVIEGCASRLQPILLTSLTTIFGLIPITFSDPLWQGLGGSIIAGLTFSGILLMLFIPALYTLIYDPEKAAASQKRWDEFKYRLSRDE